MDDPRERIAAWARRPRPERLARMAATPAELQVAMDGVAAEALIRRPGPRAWAPVEIVCHLRDTEESFLDRLTLIVETDEPRFPTTNPERWASERQYLRHDAGAAARAFGTRRRQTLEWLERIPDAAWTRAGWQMDSRGRRTVDDFVTVMAWHDENHLSQLARALDGRD